MTMHLAHPSLSLTGKKRGKVKFRNSDEARKARELDASWKELQAKWGVEAEAKRRSRALKAPVYVPPARNYRGADEPRLPSLNSGAGVAAKAAPKVYTGDKIVGIAAMHKSNLVPVFNEEAAKDISKMRRG
jgi:hypothetical protein